MGSRGELYVKAFFHSKNGRVKATYLLIVNPLELVQALVLVDDMSDIALFFFSFFFGQYVCREFAIVATTSDYYYHELSVQ